MLRTVLAPYTESLRVIGALLGSLLFGVAVWWGVIQPRLDLSRLQKVHDRLLMELEGRNEAAALARVEYDAEVIRLGVTRKKEIDDAFERGKATGDSIASGRQPVRVVWRDRCPASASRAGAEADRRASGVDTDRAEAIGRVLGIGGAADAHYAEAYARLEAAQKIVNQCYERPAR